MALAIGDRGTVFSAVPGARNQSNAFPEICVTESGTWLCVCRAAPSKQAMREQHVLVSWSDDEGGRWSQPVEPFRPMELGRKHGLIRKASLTSLGGGQVIAALMWVDHSDPQAPFFNEDTEGLLDSRLLLSRSSDHGLTWSKPEQIDTCPFDVPTPLTGPILRLADGELGLQFELNKPYDAPGPWVHKSVLMFSADGGRTWPEYSITGHDPANRIFYWDQRPAVLRDGRVFDVFWTFDRRAAAYLNIHGRESRDHGRTWSDMWNLGIPGQPAAPVQLPDGRLALVYVDRTTAPVIKCRVSEDGRSWPKASETEIHGADTSQSSVKESMKDAWTEMGEFSIGLPATAPLPDGDVLVVYYEGPTTDITAVRWARLSAD